MRLIMNLSKAEVNYEVHNFLDYSPVCDALVYQFTF